MKRIYTTILVFVVLSLLGILAMPKVPISFAQEKTGHSIMISYSWPNAAPEAMERQVTAPLEGLMGTIQGVKNIKSSSDYNKGNIILELDERAELGRARFEVASMIRLVYRSLPEGLNYPIISLDNLSQGRVKAPLLSLHVTGNAGSEPLRIYIENSLIPALVGVKGIGTIENHGDEPEEWLLEYNPTLIQSLGVSEQDIIDALRQRMLRSHVGWVNEANGMRQSIVLASTFDIPDLTSILVSKKKGRILKLSDIIKVSKVKSPSLSYFRINGKNAVQIVLMPLAGANQLASAAEVRQSLETIKRTLPSGYKILIDYDSTEYIYENLIRLRWQAGITFLLIVLLTSLIFRSWKVLFLVLVSVTAHFLLVALIFFIFKIVIRLPSLTLLIVSTGLVSGNVLTTYYHYSRRRNHMIIVSFLGSTLIMIATLSVIWLLPSDIRNDLVDFATVLIIVQVLSLSICLWLVPAVIHQLKLFKAPNLVDPDIYIARSSATYLVILRFFNRYNKLTILTCTLLFGLPTFLLPPLIESETQLSKMYNTIIGSKWYSQSVRHYADKGLGGFLRVFSNYVYEKSYSSTNEQTALHINAGLPNHSTIEQMDAVLRRIEDELKQFHEIDRYITRAQNGQKGSIVIYFRKPYDKSYFPYKMKATIIAISTEMSGIDWDIYGVGQGFNVNDNENSVTTLKVNLKGYNYKELEKITLRFKDRLLMHPRIQAVDINKLPGQLNQKDLFIYKLENGRNYLSKYNTSKQDFYSSLEKFNARPQPDLYELIGDTYLGLKVRPDTQIAFDVNSLKNEPLFTSDSILQKIGSESNVVKEKISPSIQKENQQYLRQLSFEYLGNNRFGIKFLDKTLQDFQHELSMGYSVQKASLNSSMIDNYRQYGLILLALFLVFIIAAIMFESLRQPFTMIVSILLCFAGLFAAFYYFDAGFDQGGYASFLFIMGITSLPINMIINEYNLQVKSGYFVSIEAYSQAISERIGPIMYIVLYTLCPLAPILWYGSEQAFWFAFAVGTVGGLLASLLVVLLIVPVLLLRRIVNV